MSGPDRSAGAVSGRIATVFSARLSAAIVGVVNAFLLARLLGPAEKGDFYLLQLIPSTLLVLGQMGLSSAISYYAGRGQIADLARRARLLALGLSGVLVAGTLLLFPVLSTTVFRNVDPALVILSLAIVPFTFLFTFGTAILVGRQETRTYSAVALGQVVAALVLFLVLLGALDLGVLGALVAYFLYTSVAALYVTYAAARALRVDTGHPAASLRSLYVYGAKLYPASISGFFSYRADVYLLALLATSQAQLGLYSVAVGLAELAFFLPDSVVTVFFPHVAGGTREAADREASIVTRVTIMATSMAVVPLAIASSFAVVLLLPAYRGSLPALYLLLPGIVVLSASKTMTAYLNGIGRVGLVSTSASLSLGLNLVMNLLLIPRFGILGAAGASLISYSFSGILQLAFCVRLSGVKPTAFFVPRAADLRQLRDVVVSLARRARAGALGARSRP